MSDQIELYSFYDLKSQRYDTPFWAHNEIMAKRHFAMLINDNSLFFSQYYKEINLYRIATFNVLTGELVPKTELVITGNEISVPNPNETLPLTKKD